MITKQKNYKKTLIACYLGFVTQAITANFTPLLFLTFKRIGCRQNQRRRPARGRCPL